MFATMIARLFALPCALVVLASPALAAQCGGDYNAFIANFSREAAGKGISQGVLAQAFGGITFDPKVMEFDRRQRGTFKKSWEDYARTRVGPARVNRAKQMMKKHAQLLGRVEQQFGVPKELIVSIWTMETDNGADMGKLPIVRTLATLAHDCRRTDLFQKELFAALQILQREDLPHEGDDRRLCRRDRADPVPAVVLYQVWRGL